MSNQNKWFFLKNNEVSGPFLESEIDPLAASHPEGLIWGQGFNEWVTHTEWKKTLISLNEIVKELQGDMTPQWSIKYDGQAQGPFTYDQLIQTLKAHPAAGEVLVRQTPSSEWKGVYDFVALVDEVGITRRQHNRVPISGVLRYTKNGMTFEALLASISQGGLGLLEAQGLVVGDQIRGEIVSSQLPMTLHCNCDVLYQQEDGNWGLRFVHPPVELLTVIVEYTRQFSNPSS